MSELSDNSTVPETNLPDEQEGRGSGTMVFTMILMIVGFLFAGMLLAQQTLQAKSPEGTPIFDPARLVEAGQSTATRSADPAVPEGEQETRTSPLDGIRQIVNLPPSDSVRWPRLKVTGFGKSTGDSESFAIINGDLVHPGEYAGKVKLLEIRTHDVVVEYQGEQKTLTLELEN